MRLVVRGATSNYCKPMRIAEQFYVTSTFPGTGEPARSGNYY